MSLLQQSLQSPCSFNSTISLNCGVSVLGLSSNNRSDGEDASQLGTAAEAAAAKAAGLDYVFIPVTSSSISSDAVLRFADAVAASRGPIVAHCRSGARSFRMWMLAANAEVQELSDDKLITTANHIGIAPDDARGLDRSEPPPGKATGEGLL